MSYFNSKNFWEKLDCTLKDLYIYLHRGNEKEIENLDGPNQILLVIVDLIFISLLAKLILIFFCFILKWIFCNLPKIATKLCKYKCSNFCKESRNNLLFLFKVIKKIYTYNFYSYDVEVYGKIIICVIPIVYILFIISNFIYVGLNLYNTEDKANKIISLMVFYLHLFIEIYCASFHMIKDLMKHFKFTVTAFLLSNLNILWVFIVLDNTVPSDEDKCNCTVISRIGRLVYLLFFMTIYTKSIVNIYHYNMNSKIFL